MLTLQVAFEILSAHGLNPVFNVRTFADSKGNLLTSPEAIDVYAPRSCFKKQEEIICAALDGCFTLVYLCGFDLFHIEPIDKAFQFIANQIAHSNKIEQLEACERLTANTYTQDSKAFIALQKLLVFKTIRTASTN